MSSGSRTICMAWIRASSRFSSTSSRRAGVSGTSLAHETLRTSIAHSDADLRFVEVLDAAGDCDDVAAIRLYQAEFSLEAVR